jgi:hypothetical protein
MKKALIGLGCSWTQGEGGYPDFIWEKYKGKINLPMHKSMHLIPYELDNSWVNVLCKTYFTDYSPVNLGQRGMGNRGSAKTLYLCDVNFSNIEDGIVVFLMSGFERFDFFRKDWKDTYNAGKSSFKKNAAHYNFQTLWPHPENNEQSSAYAKYLYSETGTAAEQLVNILEVQTFCKAHNLKFVLANAFDGRGKEFLLEHCGDLANKIDWTCYIHEYRDYKSFVDLLVKKDNWLAPTEHYYGKYQELSYPKTYLTNCIHPTIEGYKVIAEELADFIKFKYNI